MFQDRDEKRGVERQRREDQKFREQRGQSDGEKGAREGRRSEFSMLGQRRQSDVTGVTVRDRSERTPKGSRRQY